MVATFDVLYKETIRLIEQWLARCPDAAVADRVLAAHIVAQVVECVTLGPVIHPRDKRGPEVYAAEVVRMLEAYLADRKDVGVVAEVRIARAEAADAGEILTVQRAAYVTEAQLYGDPFLPPLAESVTQVKDAIARAGDDEVILKACLGARIVGAVRGRRAGRVGSVGRLVVAPDVQGRGVGTALMAAVEEAFRGHVEELVLSTGERSVDNLRFCRRLGYVESHRERLAPHLGLIHLRKPLDRRPAHP